MGEVKREQELQVEEVSATVKRKSRDDSASHFPIAANARTENSIMDSGDFQDVESNYSGRVVSR